MRILSLEPRPPASRFDPASGRPKPSVQVQRPPGVRKLAPRGGRMPREPAALGRGRTAGTGVLDRTPPRSTPNLDFFEFFLLPGIDNPAARIIMNLDIELRYIFYSP